jgi:hypothetical protein
MKQATQSPAQQSAHLLAVAKDLGFTVTVRNNSILTVSKRIIPGNAASFADADMSVYSVLECLPRTSPGSDWGTDGGSIGGMSAMNTGNFAMNRSGGSKLILKALSKLA